MYSQEVGHVIDVMSEVLSRETNPQRRVRSMMRHAQRMLDLPVFSQVMEFTANDSCVLKPLNKFVTSSAKYDPEAAAALASTDCMKAAQQQNDILVPRAQAQPFTATCSVRSHLTSDDYEWKHSPLRERFFIPMGADDGIISMYWNPDRQRMYMAGMLMRECDRDFSDRKMTIATYMFRATLPMITENFFAQPLSHHSANLTEKQQEVLKLALQGLSEKEIANRLHRSVHTVHVHLREIYRRMEVSSRAELMARFIDLASIQSPN